MSRCYLFLFVSLLILLCCTDFLKAQGRNRRNRRKRSPQSAFVHALKVDEVVARQKRINPNFIFRMPESVNFESFVHETQPIYTFNSLHQTKVLPLNHMPTKVRNVLDTCIHRHDRMRKTCSNLLSGLLFLDRVIRFIKLSVNGECVIGTVDMAEFLPFSSASDTTWEFSSCSDLSARIINPIGVSVAFSDILSHFDIQDFKFGSAINSVLSRIGLKDIFLNIKSFSLSFNPRAVLITGTIDSPKYGESFKFNILLGMIYKVVLAIDIEISPSSVEKVIVSIFGSYSSILSPFSIQGLRVDVSNSNVLVPDAKFLYFDNKIKSFPVGLSLQATFTFNSAGTNPIFIMLSSIMKKSYILTLSFSEILVSFSLTVSPFELNKSLVWKNIKLFSRVLLKLPKVEFGLSATFAVLLPTLSTDNFDFNASATFLPLTESIIIALSMIGSWASAFGFPKLTISNVIGSVGLMALPPWIFMIGLGGTASFGDISLPSITGSLYFQINVQDPRLNYFFGSLSGVTIGNVCKDILGLIDTAAIPNFLSDMGFGKLATSFATVSQRTPNGDTVPQGFFFQGAVNVLGYQGSMILILNVESKHFKFSIDLDSFNLGFLKVQRGSSDASGPRLLIDLNIGSRTFDAVVQGYVKVPILNIFLRVEVKVHLTEFIVEVDMEPFHLGILTIQRSATDVSGPRFHVNLGISPAILRVAIGGFVYSPFFISPIGVQILVSAGSLQFDFDTSFLWIFNAHIMVKAVLSTSKKISVTFQADLDTYLFPANIKSKLDNFKSDIEKQRNWIIRGMETIAYEILDGLYAALPTFSLKLIATGMLDSDKTSFGVSFDLKFGRLTKRWQLFKDIIHFTFESLVDDVWSKIIQFIESVFLNPCTKAMKFVPHLFSSVKGGIKSISCFNPRRAPDTADYDLEIGESGN